MQGQSALRKGRVSIPGQIYMVTTVTKGRRPIFGDWDRARVLVKTLQMESENKAVYTWAFVVMPDHLHWLVQLKRGMLEEVVGRVKSISSRRNGGGIWQQGFYDQALRKEEDLKEFARYIVMNPVRAGMVSSARFYPHWDAAWI
ncbi:MAG: REP-associated tyrosine transposase [Pseudomonadota bacterium]